VQDDLVKAGVPVVWFDDLAVDHPAFADIQRAAIRGRYPLGENLHASPDAPITRAEAAMALTGLPRDEAMTRVVEKRLMAVDHRNWFHGDLPLLWADLRVDGVPKDHRPVTRGAFARFSY